MTRRGYHGTKSARTRAARLVIVSCWKISRSICVRLTWRRIQNSRGFGLYACSNAPRHVIHLTSRRWLYVARATTPSTLAPPRSPLRSTRKSYARRDPAIRPGKEGGRGGGEGGCRDEIMSRDAVATALQNVKYRGKRKLQRGTISRLFLNRDTFRAQETRFFPFPGEHLEKAKVRRKFRQQGGKLRTVDGKMSPVGRHFYALLNSNVKVCLCSLATVERAAVESKGRVKVRANRVQYRFATKSRK